MFLHQNDFLKSCMKSALLELFLDKSKKKLQDQSVKSRNSFS